MKTATGLMIVVGIVTMAMAGIGLWHNLTMLSTDFSNSIQEFGVVLFYPIFYTTSAICIVCYTILLICGVQFVRLRTRLLGLFVGVIIFEIVYFIGTTLLIPNLAAGVANAGLVVQVLILFPLWAPFAAWWAAQKINKNTIELRAAAGATNDSAR